MDICYLPDRNQEGYGEKFFQLCNSVKVNPQIKETDDIGMMLNNGFTNCYKPIIHFGKNLKCVDNYPVSFLLDIHRKSKNIKEMSVIDENFLQPHFVDKELYYQIKDIVSDLIQKKILVKKNSGIYKEL